MSFLKNCRVSVKRAPVDVDPEAASHVHSVMLENRTKDGALIFESNVVCSLDAYEYADRRLQYVKVLDAFGCLGVIAPQLPPSSDSAISGHISYLVMVTGCNLVGKIVDFEIYRITGVQLISLKSYITEDDVLSDVRKLLSSGAFYFGRTVHDGSPYDLSVNIQNRYRLNYGNTKLGELYLRTDIGFNFVWNIGLMTPLLQWGIDPSDWLVTVICGSVEVSTIYCGAEQARMGIISRMSSLRPGTRFHARGVNDRGDVANFVETEQFIYLGNAVVSHIQVRGTVPLFWEQPGIQVGSHKINLSRGLELSLSAFERHLMSIVSHYGSTAIVNLLGSKQGEAMLSQQYQELHKRSTFKGTVPHIVFDYHSELQTRGAKSLDCLERHLRRFIEPWGFFLAVNGQMKQCQTGVLRINCVDCLDRTNAVQTLVGLQVMLPRMLTCLELPNKNQQLPAFRFSDNLRQLWQQNGDQVSRIYAGTGALGSGRSKLRDVQRSAVRTIQHSFFDSAKQEAMRTLLAHSSLQGWMKLVTEQYLPRRLLHLPATILSDIMHAHEEFTRKHKLRVFVGTWNVNGGKHFRSVAHKHESVTDWLLDLAKTINVEASWGYRNPAYEPEQIDRPVDMFAIGFEEIVDLTTSNIVAGSKPSANQREWGQFLQHHLNRDAPERDGYVLITSVQLVGVCLFVFVRARLSTLLRDIYTASVKTGLGGTAGNKGGVAIRFQIGATSICFVCSHFAAGQSAIRERNDDFAEICRRLVFPSGRNILSHDYVFWCGDFNYRINLSGPEVKRLVAQCAWSDLLRSDQLTLERQAGNVFRGFEEGPIRFAPTYKYDLFCDDYDTSEKARSPAWTDRVLWRRVRLLFPVTDEDGLFTKPDVSDDSWSPGQLVLYNRSELKTSDHRPVAAVFDIDIHTVSRDARRKVVLKCLEDYGPIDSMVKLTVQLLEAVSQQPVPNDSSHTALYRWRDFIDKLKSIAGLKRGVVLLFQFTDPSTILLTYANSKQAAAAASVLDGYIAPWTTPVGSDNIDGGYEIHLRAELYSPVGTSSWYETMQRVVEIAERDDAAAQGSAITPEMFEPLHANRLDVVKRDDDVVTFMDLEHRSGGMGILDELESSEEDVTSAVPSRQPPPRPAPPPRRPPPPASVAAADTTEPAFSCKQQSATFSLADEQDPLPLSSLVDESRGQGRIYSQSATASPAHTTNVPYPIEEPDSGLELLVPHASDTQVVTSCLDLLHMNDEPLSLSSEYINRPASSVDLCAVGADTLNEATTAVPIESETAAPSPPSLFAAATLGQAPPVPKRPAPPPPPSRKLASSIVDQGKIESVRLCKQDPFSLIEGDLNSTQSASLILSDPVSNLINLDATLPARIAPAPPPHPGLPAIPPRPKQQ